MRRLLAMVQSGRIDLTPLITHRFTLEQLPDAYELFRRQDGGVMKVAILPTAVSLSPKPVPDAAAVSH